MKKVTEQFDWQIKQEFKTQLSYAISEQRLNTKGIIDFKNDKNNLKRCESYLAKEIFLKSINFNINDWREIRKGDFYNELFLEKGLNKKKYILDKIENYLKENK
jgi:hypothetical protein